MNPYSFVLQDMFGGNLPTGDESAAHHALLTLLAAGYSSGFTRSASVNEYSYVLGVMRANYNARLATRLAQLWASRLP